LGCSDDKFEIVPATGSAVTDGVVEITVGYAVKGKYYSDVSDDVLALLPSSTINDYTYTFMVFPESVELSSSGGNTIGKGNLPGFKTWYKGGNVQWVGLGVHEIGMYITPLFICPQLNIVKGIILIMRFTHFNFISSTK
jgi:hypothetical protein